MAALHETIKAYILKVPQESIDFPNEPPGEFQRAFPSQVCSFASKGHAEPKLGSELGVGSSFHKWAPQDVF